MQKAIFMAKIRKVYFVCNEKLKSFDSKDEIKICFIFEDGWSFWKGKRDNCGVLLMIKIELIWWLFVKFEDFFEIQF